MSATPELMLGNEAIAQGALEAGVRFVSCYPGTPSSEVVETLLKMRANNACDPYIEYSVNEKVAMEAACGAAIAGAPSLVTMKHVGLNVAADPLFTAAYIGMPGGLVALSADDPGCHSSQNEQDNRGYARMAGVCCFEPASSGEAKEMTRYAFAISRELEEPVLLRATTRVCHGRGAVTKGERQCVPQNTVKPDALRYVPVPAVARKRHRALAAQLAKAGQIAETSPFNKVTEARRNSGYGVIASGVSRAYLADALRQSGLADEIGVLELGMTWPLPEKLIRDFADKYENILVLEEGTPYLERDIGAITRDLPVKISGKSGILTEFGEYSTSVVLKGLLAWLGREAPRQEPPALDQSLPRRPPNLCPGCSHRSVYYAVRKVFGDDAIYSSDIGCYTLGLLPPLATADFLVCMGSSVSAGSGYARASGKPVIGFIGDSTFFHSGISGLANAVFNKHDLLVVILDNGTTAMTGHQPNPGMAQERLGDNCQHMDIAKILAGLGISQARAVNARDIKGLEKALLELKDMSGLRVLLAQEPCLLHSAHGKAKKRVARVKKQGESAEKCLAELACPAFVRVDGDIAIDENLCGGCMVCLRIAPDAFAAKKYETSAQAQK